MLTDAETLTKEKVLPRADLFEVTELIVGCPECGFGHLVGNMQIDEDDSGTFGVAASEQFMQCENCEAEFIMDAVRFGPVAQ